MPKLDTNKVSTPYNLKGAVAPSKAAEDQFAIDMLVDAIRYHEEGDETDGPCCTGDSPCQTRIFLIGRQRELAGKTIEAREQARTQEIQERKEAARAENIARSTPGNGVVADPASPKQIAYITSLVRQHDTSKIGTFPARTLAQIEKGEEVSKGRASKLIEVLKRQPKQAAAEIHVEVGTATPAQMGFLRTLTSEQGEEIRTSYTKDEASDEIQRLLANREIRTSGKAAEEGLYRKDGVVYKVQIAIHGSGRPYAKKLVEVGDEWSFIKAPGMQFRLTAADRMTLDEAKEWGKLYGTCCVCGRTLTDEKSIADGIGPVCGGRV